MKLEFEQKNISDDLIEELFYLRSAKMEPPGGIFAFFKRSMSPASVPCVARFRLANPKQCKTILQIVSRAGDLQIPRERSLCCSLGVGKSPASVPCVARFGLANPKPCRTILQIVHGRGFANPLRAS